MKVTSQMCSPTWLHADRLAGEDVTEVHLASAEADAATARYHERLIVEGIGQFLETAIHAR
jgi:hypothetical protein